MLHMSNSFKSLLSDQVIALEWGTDLKDVLNSGQLIFKYVFF